MSWRIEDFEFFTKPGIAVPDCSGSIIMLDYGQLIGQSLVDKYVHFFPGTL